MFRIARAGALVALCALAFSAAAVTVTINPGNEYQTIDGFGGFGLDLISTQSYIDKLLVDLGVTMIRTNTGEAGETTQQWANWVNSVKARATANNIPLKFIASCWSPPASMKVNGSVSGLDANTNKLKPDQYDEYANVVKTFLTAMKNQTGIDYYGVSFQNEPAFPEPYWSCVYTPTEYVNMVKVAGPIVHAAHPNIKVFGAEHMLSNWGTFEGALMLDAAAKAQMGALAVHGYTDGVRPQPGSTAATLWARAARNATSANLPLWMTETSGYSQDWSGAMQLAEMIYAALKFGKLSAWVYWTISGGGADSYHLMVGESTTPLYYVSKNYYRYIRPGAVMIDATSNDDLVFSLAFRHKTDNTLAVVLINSATTAKTVDLSGAGIPQLTRYLTNSSTNCVSQGTTAGTGITLPASSVTTLYGTGYTPSVRARPSVDRVAAPARRTSGVVRSEAYGLDGRMVSASVVGRGLTVNRTIYSDGSEAVSPIATGN